MSSKKKNLITLVALSAVLIVCLLLYFFMPSFKQSEESEGEDNSGTITVDTITADTIDGISLEKDGKTIWSLAHKKDNWKFAEDTSIPVNEEKVTAITDALNPLTATQKIGDASDDLESYGLKSPAMILTVTAKDGREYEYQIGIKVPKAGMGYYGRSNAEDVIYCLNETLVSSIDITRNSMIQMETLPGMETDYMTYIKVDNKKGKDFEAKRVSDEEKVDFYSNWNITKPYAKPLATSAMEWKTTLGFFNALTYTGLVEYGAVKLKKYGLAEPASVITIKYYEPKEGYTPQATATPSTVVSGNTSGGGADIIPEDERDYKKLVLCVGDKTEDEYFVCEKGNNNVYKMNGDVIENMTKLDAYSSMDHCVYSVLATSIEGYDVTYGDTSLHITRTPVEEKTDADATAVPSAASSEDTGNAVENTSGGKNIWKLNGKKISDEDEEDFLTPYSTAYLLEYSEKADDSEVTEKSRKPVLTIVYHEEKRDVTVKYLPYDGTNFYRVDKNGMDYFLVDKLLVDDIIEKFKEIERLA